MQGGLRGQWAPQEAPSAGSAWAGEHSSLSPALSRSALRLLLHLDMFPGPFIRVQRTGHTSHTRGSSSESLVVS